MNEIAERGPLLQFILEALQDIAVTPGAWELDGLICGLVCNPEDNDQSGSQLLAGLLDMGAFQPTLAARVIELLGLCRAHLLSSNCDFYPLLPDEDEVLALRAEALGQWCQGFLAGYGAVVSKPCADSQETLQDLSELARIDPDLDDSEDAAWDMERVTEYLRVAVMDLFLAARQQAEPPPTSEGVTVH